MIVPYRIDRRHSEELPEESIFTLIPMLGPELRLRDGFKISARRVRRGRARRVRINSVPFKDEKIRLHHLHRCEDEVRWLPTKSLSAQVSTPDKSDVAWLIRCRCSDEGADFT